jgi:8-oxo-dGTP pyrophosphatase MutT (NUDIX family)
METVMPVMPRSPESFIRLVQERLHHPSPATFTFNTNGDLSRNSAVLLLLGTDSGGTPVVILNKRSQRVRQPGDLCCPGGGIAPLIDRMVAKWLYLPTMPLARWPHGSWWRRYRKTEYPKLALLLAAALREGFEEMRLNPFGVRFLGPMPAQHLVMFKRAIYPMVGWVSHQKRFVPNWEVEKIVAIPVPALFETASYARYRISFKPGTPATPDMPFQDMPCFVHRQNGDRELLWGATYRITEQFLKTIFDFVPPPMGVLPVIHRRLGRRYLEGRTPQ